MGLSVHIGVHRVSLDDPAEPGREVRYYLANEGLANAWDLGKTAVLGSREEKQAWRAAAQLFELVLLDAKTQLEGRLGPRWLPGAKKRSARATEWYRDRIRKAEAAYRPVAEEIDRRLAAHAAEQQRKREEEQERLRAEERRRAHYLTVGQQAVWGWVVVREGDTTPVRVFRHDVAPGETVPTSVHRRSERPLSASELEAALLALAPGPGQSRLVIWDRPARQRVVKECAGVEPSARFADWWAVNTVGGWLSPEQIPARAPDPEPGTSSRATQQLRGTSHHSSYGAGGGSGGFSCGGFGGGY